MELASDALWPDLSGDCLRDLIRSFIATGIIQLANIASGVMLARILLPAGRGELAAVMLWPPVIAAIGALGISEATVFFAARSQSSRGHIFAAGITLAIILSIILLPIGWLVVDQIAVNFSSEGRAAAFLYLAFIPLNQIGLIIVSLHQGSLSIARWNVLRTTVYVVYTALIPILYALGHGTVLGFSIASLIANLTVVILGLALARGGDWFDSGPKPDGMRALLGYGLKIHFANVVALLNERLDQLFISLQLPPSDLGLYVVAATAARGLGGIGDTLGTLVFPKIAHAETPELRSRLAGRYIRAALLMSLLPVVTLIALSEWLIALVFGQSFVSAAPVMQVLLLMIIPLNVKCVMVAALKGLNHALSVGAVQSAALILSLIALAILLPIFGLMGAAVASLVTQIAAAVMMGAEVRRRLGVGFKDQLSPCAEDVSFVLAFLKFQPKGSVHE